MKDLLKKSFKKSLKYNNIPNDLYKKYEVKKGLRNEDGTGVLVGLTTISDVVGYKRINGEKVDDYGDLFYRGISIKDIVKNSEGNRYLFEEVGMNRIEAAHDVHNPASGRVMQKAGMVFEGIHRQASKNNTGVCDIAIYAILAKDHP